LLIREQARAAGLEMRTVELPADASNEEYNDVMNDVVEKYTEDGYDTVVFGDINLESVRSYREDRLRGRSLDGRWVLWERDTGKTARDFVAEFGATVVCVDSESFDDPERFVGREFDAAFLEDLPNDVDPCGENGEFHTFVHGAPFFDYSVEFEPGEYVEREVRDGRLVYCDLVPPG
ncbi:MAG: ATP-binding protein, partial [Halobacteria archaeon]|nr:ATP-binding protein [Halobacteria archaeon]